MGRLRDLTGQTFGKLTVVERVGSDKWHNSTWRCICSCGGTKIASQGVLTQGKVKTCGCSGKRWEKRPDGEAAFTELLGRYKKQAETRGYLFHLSEPEFRSLTGRDCYYCGTPPKQKVKTHKNTGHYEYNGVDRKDNTKGYTTDNCVPCCFICNRAKSSFSQEDFQDWIKRLTLFNKDKFTDAD